MSTLQIVWKGKKEDCRLESLVVMTEEDQGSNEKFTFA
jgi:hypothetical protein